MSIPKKGSRALIIKGVSYRWRIRQKPTYCEGTFISGFSIAVERVDQPSQCILLLKSDFPRPDNWFTQVSQSITPKMIAASIEEALIHGWQPENAGSAFIYPLCSSFIEPCP
ncbi:MAG: hypothetical protein HZT40_07690 [Candidatus Thiothrix singaporensis]|uniref:Uncharacterized protein n=1 Tax=Candidatus Thiothrix singaporensis TaxID=2799669 RepID=A0A7L6AQX5_9GAMM|nr:MAG: hypothetical protein HZT40_07690 [Candidatus Thiothrix singaporensis]